jgi:hypothetical protein
MRDGQRVVGLHRPRMSFLALQMIALEGRQRVTTACDVGLQLGLGRSGAELRCGMGDEHATLALRGGIQWVYTEGVVTRVMADVGYRSEEGWLAFASTGLGFGAYYGRTVGDRDGISDGDQLLFSPTRPLAVVSQLELTWSSVVGLGFPLAGRTLSQFWGISVDMPLAWTPGSFTPIDNASNYSDLRPGVRFGLMIGLSGFLTR